MDVFEEDLQRHRTNLASLIRAQQRYNNAEREEIIRLERELRDMTGNLLSLIESMSVPTCNVLAGAEHGYTHSGVQRDSMDIKLGLERGRK